MYDAMTPVSFDIETNGFGTDAIITVIGMAFPHRYWVGVNTGNSHVVEDALQEEIREESGLDSVYVSVARNEAELLRQHCDAVLSYFNSNTQYIAAHNGETWQSGFDLPFLRRRCIEHDVSWVFRGAAYCDTMNVVQRINTSADDLVTAFDELVGEEHCDPFTDREQAVTAFEEGDWVNLILHNLADIHRTRQLAVVASDYVAQKDFRMKSLDPPLG